MAASSPISTLIYDYVSDRTLRGRFRGGTPAKIRSILSTFADHAGRDLPISRVNRRHVERWLNRSTYAPATIRVNLSTIRGFFRWCIANGHISTDPTRLIDAPRAARTVPRGLRPDTVSTLFAHLPDVRAELIVSLMVQEGLRCTEVASLACGDIDFTERVMLVQGKGGHHRVLPISDETWAVLTRYASTYPMVSGPLIRSHRMGDEYAGISPTFVSILVRRWMVEAGVKSRPHDGISAHALRHTAATDMLRAGAHVRDVQAALGHQSLATTQRYMPWVVGDLRQAMGGREYRRPQDADNEVA